MTSRDRQADYISSREPGYMQISFFGYSLPERLLRRVSFHSAPTMSQVRGPSMGWVGAKRVGVEAWTLSPLAALLS